MARETGRDASLTTWEWMGLHQPFNLADGHAHQDPTPDQEAVIFALPQLYAQASLRDQSSYEDDFARAFYTTMGQRAALSLSRPIFHYSSSVSIDVIAKLLVARSARRVALLSPTFDNIPLLLRRAGLQLLPWSEQLLLAAPSQPPSGCDAIVLVTPNNPTGSELTQHQLLAVAEAAASAGTILILDASFRSFSKPPHWDQYATLSGVDGLQYLIIEDTGKAWPIAELKLGFVCGSHGLLDLVRDISDEVLLNVSPLLLSLLTGFVVSEEQGRATRRDISTSAAVLASANRVVFRHAITGGPFQVACPESHISVEWLGLPDSWDAVNLASWLARYGIALLPGGPFHWDNRDVGNRFVRVALMRNTDYLAAAADSLMKLVEQYDG